MKKTPIEYTVLDVIDLLPQTCRTFREIHSISLREAAKQAKVDFSTLGRFERGEVVQVPVMRAVLVWLNSFYK